MISRRVHRFCLWIALMGGYGSAYAGSTPALLVPVTAFSNMEHGWQLTNRGYVAILKSKKSGKTIMAGMMSLDAMINGTKLDSAPKAQAPTLLLNIQPKFTDTQAIAQMRPEESVNGILSICLRIPEFKVIVS